MMVQQMQSPGLALLGNRANRGRRLPIRRFVLAALGFEPGDGHIADAEFLLIVQDPLGIGFPFLQAHMGSRRLQPQIRQKGAELPRGQTAIAESMYLFHATKAQGCRLAEGAEKVLLGVLAYRPQLQGNGFGKRVHKSISLGAA